MSSLWSKTTTKTARAKLNTMIRIGLTDPKSLFDRLVEMGYNRYTIKTYLEVFKGYENHILKSTKTQDFLKKHRYVFQNAYQPKQVEFTADTYKHLLGFYSSTPALYNLYVLMGSHGLRLHEALKVKKADIQNGFIRVVGKGSKLREVPYMENSLQPIAEGQDLVCVAKYSPTYRRALKTKFKCSPHDLRHFFVTEAAKKLNIYETAFVVGHADINTTKRYYQVNKLSIKNKLNGDLE